MLRRIAFICLSLLSTVFSLHAQKQQTPNVVIIYADDIGYGDFSCYYPQNKVKTPNVDKLAKESLRFTRAYCTGATCTPSRFSLLTGQYPWRQTGVSVLAGDATALIRSDRPTLASVFNAAGYQTGVVGKWHLGLGDDRGPDWNGQIQQCPNDVGFTYSYIMAATGDRVPTVYVENGRVVNLDPKDPIQVSYKEKIGNEPTGRDNPELLKMKHSHGHDFTIVNGVGRIGYMTGGQSARWIDEDMADVFTQKAVQFIQNNQTKPFLLYFATHDVHVPRVPHPRFAGKSGMGPRGDALLEFDWSVGEILQALEKNGLSKNTLVILSSDNGPVIDDGYQDQAVALLGDHKAAGPLRGGKYSIFEAGTRVPFMVKYPRKVKPGVSNALFSQVDLVASLAALIGQPSPAQARDSQNHLPALLGKDKKGRSEVLIHTQSGNSLAIVEETWKYIAPSKGPKMSAATNTELGNNPQPQLYNLKTDVYETQNVAEKYPEIRERLEKRLAELRGN
ncbi:sulfatase family protein [Haliscomenobacter hydrossis]|uniref:Steryl-sulfatase n=1 Tax=Haliscomenobacter hydrossis (strain ATCC 27775 / DSM 1100 / LMG 10767 / O) TaxID=760192 RepID=F4KXS0_HALH1|nr:arylsulfatase [Haliscomenobacter hydrossis]AEE51431.1 Steryl-sulfatase [Haliscomenobacter hydrossis DSM 1100]